MNLHITGLHIEVTNAMREYVEKKMSRINRHSDGLISVNITLSAEKTQHKAAAQAHLAGKDLHVEAIESEMYAAIDVLMDKLDRAILQHKEKANRH
ncbi:ribosome hibernation-promoting factor, HPF/YfiA family [Alysiella filiformis]|uniref:Ribosome hibernation promoting factor n=1 Tax=Alysiella filiformis DSM 16848 TaxID=1120981 RepID=A0A286E3Z5_9NEIS|nr:ribosome-associated translation inhibitor RaiA [Alysiella filiformis]QMT31046.1 ribosome-associated translation inhibitor RaiA [Alysiella filiformis]UBQ55963.1 ribosome-associated translation inhibitor RaiA [Alysiella filiformis DSM 16848]SOD65591.1 putative sigma-54 modulation protein [Alysiella filiformis DSM 16848]